MEFPGSHQKVMSSGRSLRDPCRSVSAEVGGDVGKDEEDSGAGEPARMEGASLGAERRALAGEWNSPAHIRKSRRDSLLLSNKIDILAIVVWRLGMVRRAIPLSSAPTRTTDPQDGDQAGPSRSAPRPSHLSLWRSW